MQNSAAKTILLKYISIFLYSPMLRIGLSVAEQTFSFSNCGFMNSILTPNLYRKADYLFMCAPAGRKWQGTTFSGHQTIPIPKHFHLSYVVDSLRDIE